MFIKSIIILIIGLCLFLLTDSISSQKQNKNQLQDWCYNIPWDSKYRNIVLCRIFGKRMVLKQRFFRKIQNTRIKRFNKENYYKHETDGC